MCQVRKIRVPASAGQKAGKHTEYETVCEVHGRIGVYPDSDDAHDAGAAHDQRVHHYDEQDDEGRVARVWFG